MSSVAASVAIHSLLPPLFWPLLTSSHTKLRAKTNIEENRQAESPPLTLLFIFCCEGLFNSGRSQPTERPFNNQISTSLRPSTKRKNKRSLLLVFQSWKSKTTDMLAEQYRQELHTEYIMQYPQWHLLILSLATHFSLRAVFSCLFSTRAQTSNMSNVYDQQSGSESETTAFSSKGKGKRKAKSRKARPTVTTKRP